ncbi:ATP-dependent nuclease [Halodesulfovibrio aestuarii]|uniref:ATP-dependent nuclease n=1 Tax=Halodesulfovibrio aestuarii TaxID=126333 RepID=UPI003D34A073
MTTCPNPSSLCIEKVLIKNFRCFEGEFELALNDGLNIIVGNNEAGKSTILEAINLALTGLLNGRYLKNELSQYLFNKTILNNYLKSLKSKKPSLPPSITIELHFDDKETKHEILKGNGNLHKLKRCGISLRVEFDEEYLSEYNELIKNEKVTSLPIEYYKIVWKSFARQKVTTRTIPVKTAFINSAAAKYSNGTDIYLSKIIKNALEDSEKVSLSQSYRELIHNFDDNKAVSDIGDKFSKQVELSKKKVRLSADTGSANGWEDLLTIFLDDIPFQYVGKGEQCIVKTNLALSQDRAQKSSLILIEEPENHLSHTTLNHLINFINDKCSNKQVIITTHSSFVANKLGLKDLILLNNATTTTLKKLKESTQKYFSTLPGYNTLRLLLANSAILVEGDCDELVVQKIYLQEYKKLPIEDGIDVISVGLSYKRFLELAKQVDKKAAALRDNDNKLTSIKNNDKDYLPKKDRRQVLFFDQVAYEYKGKLEKYNYNTLEPCLFRANSIKKLNKILGKNFKTEDELLEYINRKKTWCALKVFESKEIIQAPDYIAKAIEFVHEEG